MKKSMFIFISVILTGTLMLTACGADVAETDNEAEAEETTIEEVLDDADEVTDEELNANSKTDGTFSTNHAIPDEDGHIDSNIPDSHFFAEEEEAEHYTSENGSKIDSTAEFLEQHANCKDTGTHSEDFIIPQANLCIEAPEGYTAGKGDFMLIKES